MWSRFKKNLNLTLALAKINFKLRNEGSYLGILWYLLSPLAIFSLLLFLFSEKLGGEIPDYPAYMLLGIIMFNFFQQVTTESTSAITNNAGLIKSINFSREVLIFDIIFKTFFSHIFEIILFMILLLVLKISIFGLIFYLPILILLSLFTIGISFLLSSLTIYFSDLGNIWVFAVRLIWLATPLFYSIENQGRLVLISIFNPMYYFITAAREIIIYSKIPEWWLINGMIFYACLSFIMGFLIFNKLKKKFAELV